MSNTCVNGVCIKNDSNTIGYSCYCYDGYTGLNCTNYYDQCKHHNPCKNNAKCINDAPNAKCLCHKGYCGKYCDYEIDECQSNPCLNGGRCLDRLNSFQCVCQNGFGGSRCEIDKNVCNNSLIISNSTTLCSNGGTCFEGPGDKYSCLCHMGFTGQYCESKIAHCSSNPCSNESRCTERENDFHCICNFGWTGHQCKTPLYECSKNLCKNKGICMTFINDTILYNETSLVLEQQIVCYCAPDFHGQFCEQKYNECDPNPCVNDGTCIDGIDSYVCECRQGFVGVMCEINCSDPTNNSLCVNPTSVLSEYSQTLTTFSYFTESVSPEYSYMFPINSLMMSDSFWSQISLTSFMPIRTDVQSDRYELSSTLSYFESKLLSPTFLLTPSYTMSPDIKSTPIFELNDTKPLINETDSTHNIFRSRFNGVNSSIIHYSNRTKRNSFHLSLRFETDNSDGIIFFSEGKANIELILYLEESVLKFILSTNTHQILFSESGFKIIKRNPNHVDIRLWLTPNSQLHANIKVLLNNNHTGIMSASQDHVSNTTHLCFDRFYFGESPLVKQMISPLLLAIANKHFAGCLYDIEINDEEKFLSEAIQVNNINECHSTNICSQTPCRNGGLCLVNGTQWTCLCPNGYTENFCHRATCNTAVCLNDGICILPDNNNYLCICSNGWYGPNCNLKMNRKTSLFNAKREKRSFKKYSLQNLTKHNSHLELRFRFATYNIYQKKALLLFMAHDYNKNKNIIDFISITLENGFLFFRINLGQGFETLSTALEPNVTEQMVIIGHHKQLVWLILVGSTNQKLAPIIGKTPLTYKSLNVLPYLYVGGHDYFQKHPFLQSYTGFQGCIYDIELRTKQDIKFQLISDNAITKAANIDECYFISECN